jgi:6-phosphogluconolactonase
MRRAVRAVMMQAAMLIALGTSLFLTGCGEFFTPVNNNPSGGGTNSFVYVNNVSSTGTGGTLTAYSLTSGVLATLSGSPYTLAGTPSSLVVAPNNAFLYVGTNTGIFMYTIASDGTLTLGNSSTVIYLNQNNPTVQSMTMDSTSSWLIITSKGSTELDALPIDPTTGIPSSSTPVSITLGTTNPQQVTIAPANNNVFIAMGGGGTEAVSFTAKSNNPWGTKLVTIPLLKTNGSDNSVAVDTTSAYLFVGEVNSNQIRMISVANLNSETDYATGVGPSAILPDKTGTYVYVTNATDGTISGYTLSTGTSPGLTVLADSPFSTSASPIGLVEDSSKTYLLSVGSGKTPNLWMFNFDATTAGDLDVKTTTSTGTNPSLSNAIAITH